MKEEKKIQHVIIILIILINNESIQEYGPV